VVDTGRSLGRYQIIKHLASGGMAQVLLARATGIEGFERYVVIKQIHVERARDPNVVKMFLDEARLAASLHHANIVQVHDIGQDKGDYFFAMEYLHGEDLRSLLTKLSQAGKTLPLEHVITIISSAAAALHHAHEQRGSDRQPLGLVHRDVSPANIFVCYDGTVKVVDFGIAKAAHRSTETHSGTLKGKISYMAPEQCMGQDVDRRSDVFALGIVLYELYTVRRLFKASSEYLTMTSIVSGNIPKPSLHRPEIPAELETIMMKALAHAPSERYQSADEMRVALDRLATKLNLRTSTTALADYMLQEVGRRPEPWLADDEDEEIIALDVDFDGSASGLVQADVVGTTQIPTPKPGSLLARAKDRADKVPLNPSGEKHKLRLATTTKWDSSDEVPTTASGTPMAWVTPLPTAPSRRRWAYVVGTLAVAGLAVFVVATQFGGGSEPARAPSPLEEQVSGPGLVKPAEPAARSSDKPADPTRTNPSSGPETTEAKPNPGPEVKTNPGSEVPTAKTNPGPEAKANPGSEVPTAKTNPGPDKAPVAKAKPKTLKPKPKATETKTDDTQYDPDSLFIKKP
jgi:serine/threonine-protein kinase